MQIYIDTNTVKKVREVIELRAQYSAAIPFSAKSNDEIQRIFDLRDQIEELERQLGLDVIWKVLAAEANQKMAG